MAGTTFSRSTDMTPLARFASNVRIRIARARGMRISANCHLARGTSLSRGFRASAGTIDLGPDCEVCAGVILHAWGGAIRVASRTFIGPYAVIYGHGGIEIGESTLVSMHCRILSSNHSVPPIGVNIRSQPDILLPTRIGRDVWLGAGVTVLGGVTIGDGCVVGAGAVVTRDLPAGTVAYGVPARVAGERVPQASKQT